MPTPTVHVDDLTKWATSALRASGVPEADSDTIAGVLVRADLFGIHTHGVQRIAQYLERAGIGGVNLQAQVRTERVTPAVSMVDGDNGIGPLVGVRTMEAAITGARETGIGIAFARRSNHFGPVMPYLHSAAEQGFAAIAASNATTTIAPWGGRRTMIGNNPIGWGVPGGDGDPVMLDMALSVVARAKIRAAAADGQPIPTTWATDATGAPTDDPQAALAGFLQPIAGHKGYGLSVMVDLFAGVLSGAGYLDRISSWSVSPEIPQDLGHFFIAVDTSVLAAPGTYGTRIADFRERLLATPAADPTNPVRLPGQAEMESMHRQLSDGVEVDATDVETLKRLAGTDS